MSFTRSIKEEISRVETRDPELLLAELAAIARCNGTVFMQSFTEPRIRFTTSNYSVARRIFFLLKAMMGAEPVISTVRSTSFQKKQTLQIVLEDVEKTITFLQAIGMMNEFGAFEDRIPPKLLWGAPKSRAYLRGAFLVSGYIAAPGKAAHMEIETNQMDQAILLRKVMKKFDIHAKLLDRKEGAGVYVKNGEQIANFLNVIEAHQSMLMLEDARAFRDIRNQINRKVNCDTANLNKTVNASFKQTTLLEKYDEKFGLDNLEPALRELAHMRINHSSATLKELGEMFDPPISKSSINHRFRKLLRIIQEDLGETSD